MIGNLDTDSKLVFPGSFNPLHSGHISIMMTAASMYRHLKPVFAISKFNCDKGEVSNHHIEVRLKEIKKIGFNAIETDCTSFKEFFDKYTNSVIIFGLDTFLRLIDIKYYYYNTNLMIRNSNPIDNSCLIFPRNITNQEYENIQFNFRKIVPVDIYLKYKFLNLEEFKQIEISSTKIRDVIKV